MTTEAKPFIPIIDFSGIYHGTEEDKKRISLEIDQAARTSGFLVIKGHGVSKTIIDNAWKDTKDFFDLSEEEKMKYTTKDEAKYPFGYSGMGMEVLSAGKDHENSQNNSNLKPIAATADLKELFSLGPANPDAGFPERIFPSNPSTFSDSYTKYYDALSKFAQDLLEAMTGPLGVESGYFNQYLTHHASALRALNYPALPEGYECKPNEFRASAHTDYGTVTILRSGGPGLQVCKDMLDGTRQWIDVPHSDDDVFIINLGDLMRRWTNENYVSTLHRVLPLPPFERRQSMAFFHNLNRDALVKNLIPNEEDKHKPILAGDFLMEKHLASLAQSPTVVK